MTHSACVTRDGVYTGPSCWTVGTDSLPTLYAAATGAHTCPHIGPAAAGAATGVGATA